MHDIDADVKWKKSMIIVVQCCMLLKLLYPKTYLHPTSLLMQFTLINVMSAVTEASSVFAAALHARGCPCMHTEGQTYPRTEQ